MNRDYWQLRTASRNYYDAYRLTTRISNRLRALARDGEAYDIDLHAQLEAATDMKNVQQAILTRVYRNIAPAPLREFQKATTGLGEVWMARLIGEVGDMKTYTEAWWEAADPAAEIPEGGGGEGDEEFDAAPRPKRVLAIGETCTTGVRELWAYCGHGDPERRRRRNQTQEEALASGNPTAKMIVHQMAEFALRSNGAPDKNGKARGRTPYYDCYLAARAHAESLHSDWRPGHVYNHAVRVVGKAILKDLWRVQHGFEPVYGAKQDWVPRTAVPGQPVAPVRQRRAALV